MRDFNSFWGSDWCDQNGKVLLKFFEVNNIIILNDGTSTLLQRKSVQDLSLTSRTIPFLVPDPGYQMWITSLPCVISIPSLRVPFYSSLPHQKGTSRELIRPHTLISSNCSAITLPRNHMMTSNSLSIKLQMGQSHITKPPNGMSKTNLVG